MKVSFRDFVWYVLALVVATPVVFLQLDIQTQTKPSLARLVPSLFQSRATTYFVQRAIQDERWADAKILAQRNLLRRPIPAESLSLLAVARSEGRPAGSSETLEILMVAAGRGWRDPIAQTYVAGLAFEQNQFEVVAARLDALWRNSAVLPENEGLVQAVLASDRVRDELAKRYAAGVPWSRSFLSWASAKLPPQQLADFLNRARIKGGTFDCTDMARAVTAMMLAGNPNHAARSIWVSSCGDPADKEPELGVTVDQQDAVSGNPFVWTYPSESSLDRSFRAGGLHYEASDFVRGQLARRILDLSPGPHQFSSVVTGTPPMLRIDCASGGKLTKIVQATLGQGLTLFSIPEEECRAQILTLEVGRGKGTISKVSIR